jgi:hypothetical protein
VAGGARGGLSREDEQARADAMMARLLAEEEARAEAEAVKASKKGRKKAKKGKPATTAAGEAATSLSASQLEPTEAEVVAEEVIEKEEVEATAAAEAGRGGRGPTTVHPPPPAPAPPTAPAPAAGSMPAERHLTLADVGNITGRVHDEVPESTIGGQTTCIVCMVGPKSHLAVPCGHQLACERCTAKMKICPYCRESVQLWVMARVV